MKETKENKIIGIAVEDLTNCALNKITERFRKSTADLKITMNSRYVFIAQVTTIFNIESNSPILIFQVKLSIPEVEQPKLHKFLSNYPFFEEPIGIDGEEI